MTTADIDHVRAQLDALADEDQRLGAPPRVQARVMAQWDERATGAPVALRWWSYAGLAALATAVVLLAASIGPGTRSNEVHRTGTSGSEIVLADGSRVEMRAESELSLGRAADGVRIRLARGSVIVHAAKQRAGHLYVQTRDMTVSVVGTVFVVNVEQEGSLVAVIEGEVRVQHGGTAQNLRPGQQILTGERLDPIPVRLEIAWSRQAASLAHALQVATQNASAQARPEFEVTDVRATPRRADGRSNLQMEGGAVRGGRYEIHNATMVDLIKTAYGVEADAVIGGPSWLAVDRFDVFAKPPEKASASTSLMLQSLLADRFNLVARKDTRPMPAWVLSKGTGEPRLKPATSSDEPVCRGVYEIDRLSCRNVTMDAFVAWLQAGPGTTLPVTNSTGIEGAWDFDIDGLDLARTRGVSEGNPILDAVDKQLGLRLELRHVPQPVVVVDGVMRTPTPNVPGVEQRLPPDPVEFEVASIRPCQFVNPLDTGGQTGLRTSPSGQVSSGCQSLATHIATAWNLGNDMRAVGNVVLRATGPSSLEGAPEWLKSKYFDVVAKAPVPVGIGAPLVRDVKYQAMLRNLLVQRFKMVTHYEDRVVDVFTLVALKPNLKKADPSSRSGCRSTGLSVAVPTVVTCQNVTMAQLAEELSHDFSIASSARRGLRVVDETGIQGNWDVTFRYRVRPPSAAAPGVASDPTGDVSSPFEALERQLGLKLVEARRPMPVFVIDRIEETPIEN